MRERAPWLRCEGSTLMPLELQDAGALQVFLEANPRYSEIVSGRPWLQGEALSELAEMPPAHWAHGAVHKLAALHPRTGAWQAYVDLVEGLFHERVWHIGLFLVDQGLHGSGFAAVLLTELEKQARAQGAKWMRLGVVVGNARAERFWLRQGFVETRQRSGVAMGLLSQTLRVMVKPLCQAGLDEYLSLVRRDQPDQPGSQPLPLDLSATHCGSAPL